jgi:PKD repeat protein
MNRILVCILACFLFWPLPAQAGENRHLQITWEHGGPEADVAGFRIYYLGNIVCEANEPRVRDLDCEVLISSYPASFTATAYNADGRESTHSQPFLLEQPLSVNIPPMALMAADRPAGQAPHLINFNATSSYDQDGDIVSYVWDFGNGRTGNGPEVSHTYYAGGEYTVTLTVTDNLKAASQARTTVSISSPQAPGVNQPPIASISASPLQGQAPLTVKFDGLDSLDPDGELVEFFWTFGDGTTGSGETVNHIYTAPGTYTANLTVTDNLGGEDQSQIEITVQKNTSTAAGFAFNFQPAEAQVPPGFVADSGSAFREITGFGWSTPPAGTPGPAARNSVHSPDQTFDTLIHVNPGAVWELAIPNGDYVVTVCVSDPSQPEGRQRVSVEGIPLIDNEDLSTTNRWLERADHVTVSDGRLTLNFEGSAPYAKLAWLRVEHAESWKPSLYLPRNSATRVGNPVKFAWSASPPSLHLASFAPVSYTLYYGTDPNLKSYIGADSATALPGTGTMLAGFGLFGVLGLAIGRRSMRPLLTLLMIGGAASLLSSCGGGDGSSMGGPFPGAGGIAETRVIKNLETTSFQADDLLPGTTYYWKIVADDGQERVESEVFSFTTE